MNNFTEHGKQIKITNGNLPSTSTILAMYPEMLAGGKFIEEIH